MYKICVVGLGGSGGKTLQFLMDQLRIELAARGWTADHLPRCWEFVHIDVPPVPDGIGPGLPPTVPVQGGTYVPVANPTDKYAVLDQALATSLANQPTGNQLRQLVRWRPLPSAVGVEVTSGAGQYRAIGRLLTLARAGHVYSKLLPVAERLNQSAADSDARTLLGLLGLPNSDVQGTQVYVVSSLAGGTGASMTLDVCNLLRAVAGQVPNFPSASLAFLYTPDVFAKLSESARAGVNANALGTVSELMSAMAARNEPWSAEDWAVYGGVPRPVEAGRGPTLTFPVGAKNGLTGARFGDGETDTVYRGFARSLTSLFLSESQQNSLRAYVVANLDATTGTLQDRTLLSLQPARGVMQGEHTQPQVFVALGFASIGLGRDRYAEYAAQRLARGGVERLLRGHHDAAVLAGQRSPQQAATRVAEEYYPRFLEWAGLPDLRARDNVAMKGLVDDVWAEGAREALTAALTQDAVGPALRPGYADKGANVAQQLTGLIANAFPRAKESADRELREAAVRWVPAVQSRLETALLRVVGDRGLPVAERVLQMLTADLQVAAETLRGFGATTLHPHEVAQDATGELQTITANIDASHGVVGRATARVRQHFGTLLSLRGSALTSELLTQLGADLLGPLAAALAEVRTELETAEARTVGTAPVSTVATTLVQQWPRGEEVPTRFATAQNEVLLEDIAGYPRSFADQLVQHFTGYTVVGGGSPSAERSEELALAEVLTWLSADSRAQLRSVDRLAGFDVNGSPTRIGRRSEWWPQALSSVSPSRAATYRVDLDSGSLLRGARAWVARPGQVMGSFIGQGLDAYLNRPGAGRFEQEEAARRFVDRFRAALTLAAPLVEVQRSMVQAVHGTSVAVGYQFSELPFAQTPQVVQMMADALRAEGGDDDSVDRMLGAVSQVTRNRIDILGTYASVYSPVVFSSLQQPIRGQWGDSATPQLRGNFWRWRRGRSLVDFVPVSRSWLQTLVTGWLIGRLTGEVLLPGEGSIIGGGVAVWSEESRTFTRLPHPLLGAEDPARDAPGWGLLAAVVESLPLAIALCEGDTQFTALQPYQALYRLGRHLQSPDERQPNEALLAWIRDGRSRSGETPRGVTPPPGDTAEDRLDRARTWCTNLQAGAVKLLPPDPAHPGERGPFSEITAHNFWQVPREWEIAAQLVTGTAQLLANLELPDHLGAAMTVGSGGGITEAEA